MIILILAIHILAAAFLAAGWKQGRMHFPSSMLPIVLLLPLWGPVCALAVELHIRGGEKSDEEPGTGRYGITDEVYRSIRMEENGVSDVIPIEDVLENGTPVQRRKLLLSVLHSGAEPFVRPLRVAGVNDDTEVVHYAVTALVELRSDFNQRIAKMERLLEGNPADPQVLESYADLDEEYLKSGIPENGERLQILAHCRDMLERLLMYDRWQETGSNGANSDETGNRFDTKRIRILNRLGRICLEQEDTAAAKKAGHALIRVCPDLEDGYMLVLRADAAAGDGQGVCGMIRSIRERNIYISPSAREELEFWSA